MRNLILGLARRPLRLLGRDERGVIGVLVGLLLGCGVLVGLGAMVIDVGQLYQERAELQNGADAASLAVAKSCATGTCTPSIAVTYADANSSHGLAAASVCGSGSLGTCPASTGLITDCPAAPPAGTNYVDVHTSTATSGGGTVIPPLFADALLGNGNYKGTTVLACAQAEWGGAVSSGVGIITAFTISACEWQKATTTGTVYGPLPPTAPSSTLDQVLKVRSGTGAGCTSYPAPDDAVKLFGWITETGGCTLNNIPGTTYSVLSGSSSPNCNTPLFDDAQDKTLIYIPVYTSVTGSGASAVYNLLGIAGFVVTGYNVPGSSFTNYSDWLNSANNCTGTTYCINGYFVQQLLPYAGTLGASSVGLNVIRLSG
jgi:Flp pilus assembly protein TadG